jgi:transcriptional regulator with XRE-family HTH domain
LQNHRRGADPLLSALCSAIQQRRESLAISQEELAGRCGLHRTYISAIERGSRNITLKSLSRLCDALEICTSELVRTAEIAAEKLKESDNGSVQDDFIDELLGRLIAELAAIDEGAGRELMMEALWMRHRLKDGAWTLPDKQDMVLHRVVSNDSLGHAPKAARAAKDLVDNLELWARRSA